MGFLGFGENKLKIPKFNVSTFGKLPFHKEYFFISTHPAFSELKEKLDRGFDQMIRSGVERPYVAPARKFLIHIPAYQTDLVGCTWESDDGLRGFPFTLAVVLPRKVRQTAFPLFWGCLTAHWHYLAAYYEDLVKQENASNFYSRIRNVVHTIPPIGPPRWESRYHEKAVAMGVHYNDGNLAQLDLQDWSVEEEHELIQSLKLKANPKFILWPAGGFRWEPRLRAIAYLGSNGLDDLDVSQFYPIHQEVGVVRGSDEQVHLKDEQAGDSRIDTASAAGAEPGQTDEDEKPTNDQAPPRPWDEPTAPVPFDLEQGATEEPDPKPS